MNTQGKRSIAFFLLPLFFMGSGCASLSSASGHPQSFFSPALSEELAIGEKIHNQILASFYPYTDPKVVNYIKQIGSKLAAHAERQELPYHFTVLYSEKIYATSSPGGFIYLTTGMIHFLKSEAELAAVLAHEIGELQFADPRLSRGRKFLDTLAHSGMIVGSLFGEIGALAALSVVMLNAAANAAEMTPEERLLEADALALRYMAEAGYDPQGMFNLMDAFLNADKRMVPYFYDYYQSRPITEGRMKRIQEVFRDLPLQGKSLITNYKTYQEVTKGIHEMYKT